MDTNDDFGGHEIWIAHTNEHGYYRVGQGISGHWSPDGRSILIVTGEGLDRYDVRTGERKHLSQDYYTAACYSPSGRYIVATGYKSSFDVLTAAGKVVVRSLDGGETAGHSVAIDAISW